MADSRIILPPTGIISLKEHFGDKGYDGNDILALIAGPAKSSAAIFAEIGTLIKNFKYCLPEGEVPMVATNEVKDSEIASFRQSMRRYTLKTIEETPGRDLCDHLDMMARADVINPQERRKLRAEIFHQFAFQAQGSEVIILGDLDRMRPDDPAQRFLDGAFFNGAISSINGYDKGHMREHLSALREERPSAHSGKIVSFRPPGR